MKWLNPVLRLVFAGIFIFSATAKLLAADSFEVYLYQLGIFSFDWSAWVARLLIGLELFIALGFLTRACFRTIWWIALVSLFFFSVFLLYGLILTDDTNCFCFGELLSMSPGESLIKNLVLFLLLFILRKTEGQRTRFSLGLFIVSAIISIAAPVIISPPDNLLPGRITPAEMDQAAFNEALEENLLPQELAEGKRLICFYSTSCKFCRLSSSRISASFRKYDLNDSAMFQVFLGHNEAAATAFLEETEGLQTDYTFMNQKDFLKITRGRLPLVVMTSDGRVKKAWNYRQFSEAQLIDYFSD